MAREDILSALGNIDSPSAMKDAINKTLDEKAVEAVAVKKEELAAETLNTDSDK